MEKTNMSPDGEAVEVSSLVTEGDENKERGNWGGKLDFILSCIGYAVGLGNVWRFPFLAYRSGGGAFLIPYAIMLFCAGLPLFFLELSFGQFASLGPITIWRINPFFKGLGFAMVIISGLVAVYYNVIIAWALFYLFASFTSELPWQTCDHEWNTPNCVTKFKGGNGSETSSRFGIVTWCNATLNVTSNCTVYKPVTPSEEYWDNYVLQRSTGIDETGTIRWQLALCLLLAWIIIYLCLIKGIKSSGKVVYVTATFPYVVLVILLIRGCTLDGALDGILFYITPKWDKLLTAQVWGDAATQIFYSLGVAFGALHTMSSYNKFHNNCYRDALIVAIINCCTSVFAGFVIFSVIGFMAYDAGLPVEKVATSGPGLAFVVYPEGIARMPVAPLWSILFFLMLLTLGLDSQFAMTDVVLSGLSDEYPFLRKHHTIFFALICVVWFLLGLPMVLNSGIYWFTLIDWYCASQSLMIVGLFEVIAINWIYGYNNFAEDIKMMLGFKPNIYWRVMWMGITPAFILAILIFMSVQYTPVYYQDYQYPPWAVAIGWLMVVAAVAMIPLFMLIKCIQSSLCRRALEDVTSPEADWGPAVEQFRTGRYAEMADMNGQNGMDNKGYQGSVDTVATTKM